MTNNIVYIGLGSNISQPYLQIKQAIAALDRLPDCKVTADSGYFKSRPMGPKDQPDYVNAVVRLETRLDAEELFSHCQRIEQQLGRVTTRRWGERCIDLDMLLFADMEIRTDRLTVPHPGISQRDFVYLPLLKLAPAIVIPGKRALKDMLYIGEKLMTEESESDYGCHYAGDIDR